MKQIILSYIKKTFIFLIFFFVILNKNSFAQESFIKSENNPITINQNYPNWNELSQRQPFILFDSNKYKLWYNSDNENEFKIGYAESTDLNNWNGIQLLNLDNTVSNQDPTILKNENDYVLYYSSSLYGGDYKIHEISSNDGKSFDMQNDKVILTPTQSWETRAVSSPYVIEINNKRYLFYSGWNGRIWNVGLAISDNGVLWNKCQNNPIISIGSSGPHLLLKDNKLFLYFHNQTATKISYLESNDELSCNTNWSEPKDVVFTDKPYDQQHLTDPSLFIRNDATYLFYSGQNLNNIWRINYALNRKEDLPIIVFIPGFMTTWNKNAILYNQDTEQKDWKLLNFIKEYDGLKNTLINIGYEENKNIYFFSYDWRQKIDKTLNQLNIYIDNEILSKNPNSKVTIIGHSLGGLIGRLYSQIYHEKINKIITVGSPNHGSPSIYKVIQAGEIELTNDLLYLAQNVILNLYREKYLTNKETVWNSFPVLLDIYPSYDFLYDENNNLLTFNTYNVKNNYLVMNNQNVNLISDRLYSIYGIKGDTLFGYKVKKRSTVDSLIGNYIDGVPIEKKYEIGDLNIPAYTTIIGINNYSLDLDHEELIYSKKGIKKILDLLSISYAEENIIEGNKTNIDPSIILIMKSPAIMKVIYNDQIFEEKDGLIFIDNVTYGEYEIIVNGKELGDYSILVGLINNNKSNWFEINGKITNLVPNLQTDKYKFEFNEQNSSYFPIIDKSFDIQFSNLINILEKIKTNDNKLKIRQIISKIKLAKIILKFNRNNNYKNLLLQIHRNLFKLSSFEKDNIYNQNKIFRGINILESIYIDSLTDKNIRIKKNYLLAEYKYLNKKIEEEEKELYLFSKKITNLKSKTQILITLKKIINDIENALNNDQLLKAEIYFKAIKLYFQYLYK